jgi:PBSX family phage terminase large subunit
MFRWGEFSEKSRESIIASTARINIWDGAVRSGKTISSILRWLEYVQDCPDENKLLMVGKTERTLRRNVLDVIQDMVDTEGKYNRGLGLFHLFGKQIEIIGANDERAENKIRGVTLAGAYGDEISLWPENFFRMLLSRLSVEGAKFFGTTNPDSPYHWLKTGFLDEHELNLKRFHFTLQDNPNLPLSFIRELEKEYTGLWHKRFIRGLWVLAEGSIYDMWNEESHIVDVKKMLGTKNKVQFDKYIVSIDYGTNNPCTFGLYGFDHKLPVYLQREYYYDSKTAGRQKTDSEYADDFDDFVGDVKPLAIYCDPSAASFIAELRRRGYRLTPAKNDVVDGIRFVGNMLRNGEYLVDKSCKHTIQEFSSYIWDEKAQKRGEDKPLKEHDHTMDRDRYGLFTHFYREPPGFLAGFNYN